MCENIASLLADTGAGEEGRPAALRARAAGIRAELAERGTLNGRVKRTIQAADAIGMEVLSFVNTTASTFQQLAENYRAHSAQGTPEARLQTVVQPADVSVAFR